MQDVRGLSKVGITLMVVGGGLLVAAIVRYASAPGELPMGTAGWFESAELHSHAVFVAMMLGMIGVVCFVTGIGMTNRVRRLALELQAQQATALTEGVVAGLGQRPAAPASPGAGTEARLAEIDRLRDRGVITAEEHAAKRKAILDAL